MIFPDDFKIVCLHLLHRTDRLPLIKRATELCGAVEVVEGYTPETAPRKLYPAMPDKKWAVAVSKLKAFEFAVQSDKEYVLFLEDDCVFENEENLVGQIQCILELAADFDILYGGCWKYRGNNLIIEKTTPVYRYIGDELIVCNHCLFFRKSVMKAFIARFFNPDGWENILDGGNWHSDVMLAHWQKDYNLYICNPFIANQRGGASDNYNGHPQAYPKWYYDED